MTPIMVGTRGWFLGIFKEIFVYNVIHLRLPSFLYVGVSTDEFIVHFEHEKFTLWCSILSRSKEQVSLSVSFRKKAKNTIISFFIFYIKATDSYIRYTLAHIPTECIHFALGLCIACDPQRKCSALPIPTCWYPKTLANPTQTLTDPT